MKGSETIPRAIFLSECYTSLNLKQQESFYGRLKYYSEIVVNVNQAEINNNSDLESLIDDIDLDITAINMSYSGVDTGLSLYAITSLWTSELETNKFYEYMDEEIKYVIESTGNMPNLSFDNIRDWFKNWAELVHREMNMFFGSKTFDEGLSHLLLIIALMNLVSCATALARLNNAVFSR